MKHDYPGLGPWTIRADALPSDAGLAERLRFAVGHAILAPSGHNTQPWLFRVCGDEGVEVLADRTRALPVVDPHDRELTISCGAALCFLRLALRCLGTETSVELLPDASDQDLLARIRPAGDVEASADDQRLFRAIPERRTDRQPFEERAIEPELLEAIGADAIAEGAWLHVATGADERATLAALVAEGDRRQMTDASFRRELAAWLHANRHRSRDGLRGYSFGIGDFASYAGPFVIRTFDVGRGQAAKDRAIASGSPALLVLGTDGDEPRQWLQAGHALGRLLLRATACGLGASYLNQPVELPELRARLAAAIGVGARHPQLLMRMGVSQGSVPATPRRAVGDVLI